MQGKITIKPHSKGVWYVQAWVVVHNYLGAYVGWRQEGEIRILANGQLSTRQTQDRLFLDDYPGLIDEMAKVALDWHEDGRLGSETRFLTEVRAPRLATPKRITR